MAKLATQTKPAPQKAPAGKLEDILDRPSNEAVPPPLFPAGTWLWTIVGLPRFDKSSKKQTPFVEFTLKPMQALDDVDPTALEEFGSFADKTKKATFYLTDNSEFMLKEFFDACSIADEDDDGNALSHRQRIEETPNAQVFGVITHKPNQDGTRMNAEIGQWAKVEE